MTLPASYVPLASSLGHVSAETLSTGVTLHTSSQIRDLSIHRDVHPGALQVPTRALQGVSIEKDSTKLHVWIRTDERPLHYDSRSGVNHDGLNQTIRDIGGRHRDVVVGNSSRGYYKYGLEFNDHIWLTIPNGDGAAVGSYAEQYTEVKDEHELFKYMGQVKDGRRTLKSIGTIAKSEIAGKTYDHNLYNCATFATDLAKRLI
ncbi:hypothetical protein OPT61_g6870 [Boeremia exigua]|uniref:Uncharacterized protein n=1 Tax=Boeremia exigua TaxID=749465 RepID=A0ACC2I5L1_9PLEO|nr:hypothetical protein OPT61_g6870 [Boeremia exigua]